LIEGGLTAISTPVTFRGTGEEAVGVVFSDDVVGFPGVDALVVLPGVVVFPQAARRLAMARARSALKKDKRVCFFTNFSWCRYMGRYSKFYIDCLEEGTSSIPSNVNLKRKVSLYCNSKFLLLFICPDVEWEVVFGARGSVIYRVFYGASSPLRPHFSEDGAILQ